MALQRVDRLLLPAHTAEEVFVVRIPRSRDDALERPAAEQSSRAPPPVARSIDWRQDREACRSRTRRAGTPIRSPTPSTKSCRYLANSPSVSAGAPIRLTEIFTDGSPGPQTSRSKCVPAESTDPIHTMVRRDHVELCPTVRRCRVRAHMRARAVNTSSSAFSSSVDGSVPTSPDCADQAHAQEVTSRPADWRMSAARGS
jgi:hypothetical protein